MLTKGEFVHCGIVPFLSKLEIDFLETFRPGQISPPKKATNYRMSVGKPPTLSHGREWFSHYDTTRNKALSQEEVVSGIIETFKIKSGTEKAVVRDTVEHAWPIFDDDYSGEIDLWEFLVKGGFHDFLILLETEWKERPKDRTTYHFLNLYFKSARRHTYAPPPPLSSPEHWFKHFDFDYTGILTEKEAIHGLYATLNAVESKQRQAVRQFITQSWEDEQETMTLEEFLKHDGMANKFQEFEKDYKEEFSVNETKIEEKLQGTIKIRVHIAKGQNSGDVIKVCSPKTNEIAILLVPDKIVWGKDDANDPYYFDVTF